MKKQLNLICVLIFFFVGLSLVPSIYSMGNAFVDGFKEGMSHKFKKSSVSGSCEVCGKAFRGLI